MSFLLGVGVCFLAWLVLKIFFDVGDSGFFAGKNGSLFVCAFLCAVLLGILYYSVDDYFYKSTRDGIGVIDVFEGVVVEVPRIREDGRQTLGVEMGGGGRVLVYTYSSVGFSYGDEVIVRGEIRPPPLDSYGNYLAKERIHGVVFYPGEIEVKGTAARPFYAGLYGFREQIKENISKFFTRKRAAFLNGVLLGDRDNFSEDFLKKLSHSGTMHLTALSGLHMAIIIFMAFSLFSVVFLGKKKAVFIATFSLVFLFVAMTGFKISAIRASLMAFIVGLARQSDRMYNPRNAIVFAALMITLFNPKAPVFDLAFQLSFAATCSIIYFSPVIRRLSFFKKESFLNWRDILSITIAAQIGVAPITIIHFENLSLSALPANIAILVVIPLLMVLGFATVAASFVLSPVASLLSMPVSFLVDYSVFVVELFYKFRVPFNPDIGFISVIFYYAVLIFLSWRFSGKFFKKNLEKF